MDTHVKALGLTNIIFGAFSVLFVIVAIVGFGGFSQLSAAAWADFTFAALFVSLIFHAFVAIPCIVLGALVMRYNDSAKSLLIMVSAFNLLNVPLGPFVGGYGLWVLLQPETEPLFVDPHWRRGSRKKKAPGPEAQEPEAPKVKGTSILRSRGADAGPQ